jgi:hypothetical protein
MIDPSNYTGEKIELSSGQLLFNARSENIFLNSAKYISLSVGESIHFDIGPESTDNENNKFLVNAPRIEFKLVGKGRELTPVVRSQEMIEVIKNLLIALNEYSTFVTAASRIPPIASVGADMLNGALQNIQTQLDTIKSDLTYTQ